MTTIFCLPDELLELVVNSSRPHSFESLALTCKRIFTICEPYAKRHNELNHFYRRFSFGLVDPSFPIPILKAIHLVARIIKEPMVARYILEADLRADSRTSCLPAHLYDTEVTEQQCEDAIAFIKESNLLKDEGLGLDKNEFATALEKVFYHAYSQHATVFLLSMLPNLQKLILPSRWEPNGTAITLLDTIVRSAVDQTAIDYGLRNVIELLIPPTQRPRPLHHLSPLLCLPALQDFVGVSLAEATETAPLTITTPAPLSPEQISQSPNPTRLLYVGSTAGLQNLDLRFCCLSIEGLGSLLKTARLLRSLRYHHAYGGDLLDLDLVKYLDITASSVGSHLEELSLTHDNDVRLRNARKIDLREQFPSLRILELPVLILSETGDIAVSSNAPHFSSMIPSSVTKLSFTGLMERVDTGRGLTAFFQDFCETKQSYLPELTELHICYPAKSDGEYNLRCADLQDSCNGCGTVVNLHPFVSMKSWLAKPHQSRWGL